MSLPCQVVAWRVADGPRQMSTDEAMLDMVALGKASSLYRTYSWAEPTLSLGYFQRLADVSEEDRFRSVPVVRRPSGGGALWHEATREMTYAVVVPESHPLARPSSKLYQAVHAAIATTLRSYHIPAERRADLPPTPRLEPKPLLCFLDQDDDDLLIAGHKIVGSAQRRRHGAVLQHGSIVMGRSATTPELPGIEDLIIGDPVVTWVDFFAELNRAIFEVLKLDPSEIHPDDQSHLDRAASRLEVDRYRTTLWNARR